MVSKVMGIGGLSTESQVDWKEVKFFLLGFFSWKVTNGCTWILRGAQHDLDSGW